MSNTLIVQDTINRLGYTIIDGIKVVQYNCVIPSDNPDEMKIITSKLNNEMYKQHRVTCRADLADFEDAAYELQDTYIAKITTVNEDDMNSIVE